MRVALVGNQNSGKTTLFNLLTGSHQKIGNWPGVTIEKKEGIIRTTDFELIDLPGVYSLSAYSQDEKITVDYLLNEKVDLIVNIIDATAIERSLYLTTQLLELNIPVVIALNMSDLIEKNGIKIDFEYIEKKLDTTIIQISALKKFGILNLIQAIKQPNNRKNKYVHIFDHILEDAITKIEKNIDHPFKRYIALKLIEGHELFAKYNQKSIQEIIDDIKPNYQRDLEQIIVDERYRYIESIRDESIKWHRRHMTVTDKVDRVILNKYLALPIFMGIMFLIYYLAAGPFGSLTVDFVDQLIGKFSEWFNLKLISWNASDWSRSLVIDGVVAGVGAVLNFVPQLIILFIGISLLETTGYMSRIAFFLDRVFQKVGLSGKSLIPFIVGSGCSVPAIMSARSIQDETEKKVTIMLTPFIPCSAKLPIITLFAGYFFSDHSGLVSASLYFLAIILIIGIAFVFKKIFYKDHQSSFILELPSYKVPQVSYIVKDVYQKVAAFVVQAGTIIFMSSVLIWFLISFSFAFEYGVLPDESMLAGIGKVFSWLFYPFLGTFSWEASVSVIQGLVAKEQVISSMAIIAGFSEGTSSGVLIFNASAFSFFSASSAYAFMVFNLFSAPCFGSIGAMKKELRDSKSLWLALGLQTGIAWVLATIVYQVGHLIEVLL